MLIYFHKHKANYEKGQLAPLYIFILVIIMIMALVTLNLSKVAFIKTDSSNAVDSGGLAAGSIMANSFNSAAVSNSQMETQYWQFYAMMALSFTIALAYLTHAYIKATAAEVAYLGATGALLAACVCKGCCGPWHPGCCACWWANCAAAAKALAVGIAANGAALASLGIFIKTTIGITAAVTMYSAAQLLFYKNVKKMALTGRRQAVVLGERFAFSNSGIGAKLKSGGPPAAITQEEKKNNYQNSFSDFLNALKEGDIPDCQEFEYLYPWQDGQERKHSVRVKVNVPPVNKFELKVAVLPLLAELGLLGAALWQADSAEGDLAGALAAAGKALSTACASPCSAMISADLADSLVLTAMGTMYPSIFILMAAALAGLLPGPIVSFNSPCGSDIPIFIIAWIDEITHSRRLRVDTWQEHGGADLGLLRTNYPQAHSFSEVDFRGYGKIHDPTKPRFDPSIVATDQIGS